MSIKKGQLQPNQLPARILAYFACNPEEELSFDDLASKFDARPPSVRMAVYKLRSLGRLELARVIRLPTKGRAS